MLACIHEHTLTKIANYQILWTTSTELPKSFSSSLCSFRIISDTHREHHTDLIAFLFHDILCARRINTSSTCSWNQRLSQNFCCHTSQRARPAVQFSITVQSNRTNKASHIFTGNHHSTESFLRSLSQHWHRANNKNYLVSFPITIFDLNTPLEPE